MHDKIERFDMSVVDCDDGKYIMIMDKFPDDNIVGYLINHENFNVREKYCKMLVNKLNEQNEEIIRLKKEKNTLDELLNIRNFIE